MKTAILWQFVVHKNGAGETWTWRRARLDGTPLEVSADAHPSYGKVIYDAIQHGFQPRREPWVVTDGASITHFWPDLGAKAPRKAKRDVSPTARRKGSRARGASASEEP